VLYKVETHLLAMAKVQIWYTEIAERPSHSLQNDTLFVIPLS